MHLSDEVTPNAYTTGRYIVLAVKHVINVEAQRHEMVLKC